ncbi:P83/100 family protein [Candidatus Borreliella tachyglossi]|uniref:P83/100 family protein n=1 Tax=Candidatus Borreliella tachyglossi TaxID=1964448 RepID=UPI004041BCDD
MKRIWIIGVSLFVLLNIFTLHARELDKKRLKDFVDMDLEFVNYRGPYEATNTYREIVGIGEFLARNLTDNKSNYYNKYYVNRYIDDKDVKSSTDVFLIGERSALDSILNLRRILTGYFMEAFKYDRDSAELLAKAITIYNAVYRGDLNYYSSAYIQAAVEDTSKENVGLSRVYSQWTGKTHIFIPLKRDILSGDIESDIDLDRIVTDKVIESLLNENAGGTDFARDLTDIQDEGHGMDQGRIDFESDTLESIDDGLRDTIDNLREQLEKATDEEKADIQKQIEDKRAEKEVQEKKARELEESQKKLDDAQDKLDIQRDVVKDKMQENLDKGNRDKNLPEPGEISSPKVDKKLELTEAVEDLEEQLEKATDEEKADIQKQIEDKRAEKEVQEKKARELEESQKKLDDAQDKLDIQRDVVKDKMQENFDKGNRDKNLPEPGEISSPKVDKKLELTEAIEDDDKSPSSTDVAQGSDRQSLDSKEQGQVGDVGKSAKDEKRKSVFLEVLNPSTNLGVLQFIDSDGNKLEEASQYGIRRYGIYERSDDLVAIKLCSGIAKLQVLNKLENLKVESESEFELSRDSSLFVDEKMILVVVKDNNAWKLAKFSSKNLSDFILSENEVLPFTSFTVKDGYVYLQDTSKRVITLDLDTLKKVS